MRGHDDLDLRADAETRSAIVETGARVPAWLPALALCIATACGDGDDTATSASGNGGTAGTDAGAATGSGGRTGDGGSGPTGGAPASNAGGSEAGTQANGGAAATGGAPPSDGSTGAEPNDGGATIDSDGGTGSDGQGGAGASLGTFQLTYYWVTAEDDFTGTKDTTLYDDTCGALATVTFAFAQSLRLEGTGRLSDGRVLNVSGSCSCSSGTTACYVVLDAQHSWGLGARGAALVPFRTIAVDRNVIALGSHVYVAEFDGVTMPGDATYGQFVHDGCVTADDVGGGIVGQHIDFFAALEAHYRTLDAALGLNSVTVYAGGQRCP